DNRAEFLGHLDPKLISAAALREPRFLPTSFIPSGVASRCSNGKEKRRNAKDLRAINSLAVVGGERGIRTLTARKWPEPRSRSACSLVWHAASLMMLANFSVCPALDRPSQRRECQQVPSFRMAESGFSPQSVCCFPAKQGNRRSRVSFRLLAQPLEFIQLFFGSALKTSTISGTFLASTCAAYAAMSGS